MTRRQLAEQCIPLEKFPPGLPAERPMCEQADAVSEAVLWHAAPQVAVLEDAHLHLDGADLRDLSAFLQLSEGDVAEADCRDLALALQRPQRAHARGEGRARVGRVQLVEIDALDAQGTPAALAGCDQ